MAIFSICFALGVLVFHQLAWLPGWYWFGAFAGVCGLLWRLRRLRPVAVAVLGFVWSHAYALVTLPPYLPDSVETASDLLVRGHIVSLPQQSNGVTRLVFDATTLEFDDQKVQGRWRFRLSWREPPSLRPGDGWRLPVRLRRVHGYASPGAWDYEGWLYWQGIRYRGYVQGKSATAVLDANPCCRLTRLRGALRSAIDSLAISEFSRGVIRAITIGDGSGLSKESKALLRASGTSHLMAISGLHVGLLAGLGLLVVGGFWARLPVLCRRVPARVAGAVAGLSLAVPYSLLAGMGLPTQRALIMLLVFAVAICSRRHQTTMNALALAAFLVLAWHPPSVLSAGFWLSFVAVAAILAAIRLAQAKPVWVRAVLVQLSISLALWPVLMNFGMLPSPAAPLVNLILVPLFGFVIVPLGLLLVLLLALLPNAAHWLAWPLGSLLDGMYQSLELLVGLLPMPGLVTVAPGVPSLLLLVAAVGLLLVPPGVPLRWLGIPVFGILFLPPAPRLVPGEFELHLLDVGQGLGSVIETRHHTLVFDTGPEYRSGFSTAAAVIHPFLRRRGRNRIDRLILSHGDKDHAGGVEYLRTSLDVVQIQSGEPARIGAGVTQCVAGERWQWDGVDFEFLHPPADSRLSGNDASCVLRISNVAGSVLFTGDIGRGVEAKLVLDQAEKLHSRLVVAAHHGSRSSSDDLFVATTMPDYVLFASGWKNRYGFPAPEVAARWREAGAQALNTSHNGSIGLRFRADGTLSAPDLHRVANKRFWRHDGGLAQPGLEVSSGD